MSVRILRVIYLQIINQTRNLNNKYLFGNLNNISFVKQLVFYIIKLFAHIYMSAIAGKTAGPNGLTFFRKPMGTRGVT